MSEEGLVIIGFCKICGSPMFGKLVSNVESSEKQWQPILVKTCGCSPMMWDKTDACSK